MIVQDLAARVARRVSSGCGFSLRAPSQTFGVSVACLLCAAGRSRSAFDFPPRGSFRSRPIWMLIPSRPSPPASSPPGVLPLQPPVVDLRCTGSEDGDVTQISFQFQSLAISIL